MHHFLLIDLCCPADLGAPKELAHAGAQAGLEALLYVVDGATALPDQAVINEIAADPELATLHPAVAVRGEGYGSDSSLLTALESMTQPELIEAAANEAGGCAIPVSPRQGPDGEVFRKVAPSSDVSQVGTVACVAGGSMLGRDLDLEDTALAHRRVLAGTGPYGSRDDLGRFATLLPITPGDVQALINALNLGLGLACEFGNTVAPKPPKKRRRRRRNAGKRRNKGGAGDSESPAPAAD